MKKIITLLLTSFLLCLLITPAYADNYTMGSNDKKTVTLKGYGQTHKIKINLKESGYFNISFIFHEPTNGRAEIYSKVYDDLSNSLLDSKCNDEAYEEYRSVEGYYRAGTYTIEVWRTTNCPGCSFNNGSSRKVTITTESKSSKESFPETNSKNNDGISKANKIVLDKEYRGVRASWDHYDYYEFELKDNYTNPEFTLNWFGNDKTYIQLFDKSGNRLKWWYQSDRSVTWNSGLELKKGTYYICFGKSDNNNGGLGEYSFKISKSYNGWMNNKYWYENGVRQGMYGDPKCVYGDGTCRGREIYDPDSNGWYWLDAVYEGAKATNKEVWMPYIYQDEDPSKLPYLDPNDNDTVDKQVIHAIKNKTGKWVRYDSNGKMYKEWYQVSNYSDTYPTQRGNKYYYDPITGLMAKGGTFIGRDYYFFDPTTGALQ